MYTRLKKSKVVMHIFLFMKQQNMQIKINSKLKLANKGGEEFEK